MKKAIVLLAVAASLAVTRGSAQAPPPSVINGELIDSYCYAAAGVRGMPHAACALKCARAGVPVALLDAKTHRVYVLLASKDAAALPLALVAQMGRDVEITGDLLPKLGTSFLTVRSFRVME
jgi:hypothetical protein